MLQRGTRPHCKQAAGLFTWPNYPSPIGDIAPGKGPGSGEHTVNSSFIASAGTGICQKTKGKTMAKKSGSIHIQKVNIACK